MFDIEKTNEVIENNIEEYFVKAKKELERELTSAGYNHIFDNVNVSYSNKGISINFDLKGDIKSENQNVIGVLARGGVLFKEDDSYIQVKPSLVISKYLMES